MKVNRKKCILLIIFIVTALLIFIAIKFNTKDSNNKEEISMVEKYLSDKYNMPLKTEDFYYYDNGDLGINAGKHYEFKFKPIQGFELYAYLDFITLKEENLKHIDLNITNIEKANELKKYVEKNSGLSCKVTECRAVESKNNYYVFRVELENDNNYWISGNIYNTIEDAKGICPSTSLSQKLNLENAENIQFNSLLNQIKNIQVNK